MRSDPPGRKSVFVRWEDDGSADQKKLAVSMQKRTADERRWTQILRHRKSGFSVLFTLKKAIEATAKITKKRALGTLEWIIHSPGR